MAIVCSESSPMNLNSQQYPNPPLMNVSRPNLSLRCTGNLSVPSSSYSKSLSTEPNPVFTSVKSFAPATVANLGPGFDFLGCAVDGLGDFVSLRVDPQVHPGEISISDITGVGNFSKKLSRNPLWNCAGIAAISVMKMLNIRSVGLSLSLHKGLPLGSGLGSSAASAVLQGDLRVLGMALSSDKIVEPKRAPLIPGMDAVKKAAIQAGAFGCTISGAGPTAVAVTDDLERGKVIGDQMVHAFMEFGNLKAAAMVKQLDRVGARVVSSTPR